MENVSSTQSMSSTQYVVWVSEMIDGVRRTRTEIRERNTKPLVRTEASHPWQLHSAPLPSCPLPTLTSAPNPHFTQPHSLHAWKGKQVKGLRDCLWAEGSVWAEGRALASFPAPPFPSGPNPPHPMLPQLSLLP